MTEDLQAIPNGYRLELTREKDCFLCNDPRVRKYDELIYSRIEQVDRTKERFYNELGIILGKGEIFAHRSHLCLVNKLYNKKKEIDELLKLDYKMNKLDNIDSLDLCNSIVNKLRIEMAGLELTGHTQSGNWLALQRALDAWSRRRDELLGKIKTTSDINITIMDTFKKKLKEVDRE